MKLSAVRSLFVIAAIFVSPAAVLANAGDLGKGLPAYTANGELKPPSDFYDWAFLTSDLGMSYNESGNSSDHPPFSNVFVNPAAYRAFLKTGTWPDHTQFVKEFRDSATQGSINHEGFYQRGARSAILVHVKDTKRFKGGWAFFVFDGKPSHPATRIPVTANCYSCHEAHGAVDTTFVQFYPELLPVAVQHATLGKGYLTDEAKLKQ
ncbi:MAG TPA: cytochrome P460 family protein [Steroidobacteraceae bacterium]|jgi:hypothetical protein|nr:cytochrome P460 family protein [Steroidobacteraceae bacterium]